MSDNAVAGPNATTISFSREVYDIEAVKRAAYRFSDYLVTDIEIRGSDIQCRLTLLSRGQSADLTALAHRFKNEVLDQDLRARIARETEAYRNLILSLAFSKTGVAE